MSNRSSSTSRVECWAIRADGEAAQSELHRRGLEPLSALVRRSTLEDVFLHLTGRTLVD